MEPGTGRFFHHPKCYLVSVCGFSNLKQIVFQKLPCVWQVGKEEYVFSREDAIKACVLTVSFLNSQSVREQ